MKILVLGDIVGTRSIYYLKNNLWKKRRELMVDFVVANAENASDIHGLSKNHALDVLDAGVDFMTMGNHTFAKRDLYDFLDENPDKIIRPANYPATCPGYGSSIVNVDGYKMLCINVQGTAFMESLDSPFDAVECILGAEEGRYDFSILDIHAEATSEKYAIARYFDGKINMIFGTHTHVQTADEQILPGGSGYITDIGMVGPKNGILGTDANAVIYKMKTHMPSRFTVADGEIKATGVIFDINANGKVNSVKRVAF